MNDFSLDSVKMIVIVDYKMGNLGSIKNMLKKIGFQSEITSVLETISSASRLILPGVGAFDNAMKQLSRLDMLDILNQKVLKEKVPILGICLGMQLLTESSEEGKLKGLGWIAGRVIRFREEVLSGLKVPHMGWNEVQLKRNHPLFEGVNPGSEFYFVHSYYPCPTDPKLLLGETDYGRPFTSVISSKNLFAVQFHLEKSGRPGLRILSNFCDWSGKDYA